MQASPRLGMGVAFAAILVLGGCEAVLGLGNETSSPGDAGMDAGSPGNGDAGRDAGHPQDAASDVWVPIAFNAAGSATCPSGFSSTKVIEVTTSGSCTCSMCSPSGPDCESGVTLSTTWPGADGGATCTAAGVDYVSNGGNCEPNVISPVTYMSITASAPPAGTCSAQPTAFEPKGKSEIVCTPAVCTGNCTSGHGAEFQACLYQAGDRPCPAAEMVKHSVGSQATTKCGACSCSVTATCSGMFAIYDSTTGCTGSPVLTVPADGTCHAMTGVVAQDSYVYTASPTNVSCDAGTSTATDVLGDPATICCP
jgi:hypothetical protein